MAEELKDYVATRDGWIDGRWRRAGDRVAMAPRNAAYEPMLAPAPSPVPEPMPAPAEEPQEAAAEADAPAPGEEEG